MACVVPDCIFSGKINEIAVQLRHGDMDDFDRSERLPIGSVLCLSHYGAPPSEGGPSRREVKKFYKHNHRLGDHVTLHPSYWKGSASEQREFRRRLRRVQMEAVWLVKNFIGLNEPK
jgi:hypothetical protein